MFLTDLGLVHPMPPMERPLKRTLEAGLVFLKELLQVLELFRHLVRDRGGLDRIGYDLWGDEYYELGLAYSPYRVLEQVPEDRDAA